MRVLHVMEATIGGTRRHLADVAGGQLGEGLEVHVAASAEREPAFRGDLERLAAAGVRVHEVPMVRSLRPATDARHFAALARLLEHVRPDVVHTHSSKAGVLGRLASAATGIGARVHTPHTFAFLFEAMFSPLKRRLFREIETALAGETAAVIAVSPTEARTFVASGVVPASRVRTVVNGIDPAPWIGAAPLGRDSLGLDPGRPIAVVAGLLNAAKGQDLLLEALADPRLEDLQAVVCGHGEDRPRLEELTARLDLAPRVRFLGWRDDLPSILGAADLLVLPSRWEGMPYVVLEAMAAGLGVVATPVDGARDVIEPERTGLLAREISAEALAEALAEWLALTLDERERMGALGREHVLGRYTLAGTLAGLRSVYEQAAGG